jgi:hypothetical protein
MDFNKLVQRVKALLASPRTEWPVIAAEPATVASLYREHIAVLAAIPAVCGFIKSTIIGYGWRGFGVYHFGVVAGLSRMIVGYAISLVSVYLLALIIDALAPTFGGQGDRIQALKAAAYSYTSIWIAGFGELLPLLSVLIALAGLVYTVYLLYLGLPSTMKAPPDRAAGYTAVTVIIAMVLGWIIAIVTGGITGMATVSMGEPEAQSLSGTWIGGNARRCAASGAWRNLVG